MREIVTSFCATVISNLLSFFGGVEVQMFKRNNDKWLQSRVIFRNDQRNWVCLTWKEEMWHLSCEVERCAGLLDVYNKEYSSAFLLSSTYEKHIKNESKIIQDPKCECYEDQNP